MPMSQTQFLEHQGNRCPNCESEDLSDFEYTWADACMVIDTECYACGSIWQVIATITEYVNLETREEQ